MCYHHAEECWFLIPPTVSLFFHQQSSLAKVILRCQDKYFGEVFCFFLNVFFLSAFDCIRASCRTVSSSIFLAGMEAKTDYVIVPSIYSQNLTRHQHMKIPDDHNGI